MVVLPAAELEITRYRANAYLTLRPALITLMQMVEVTEELSSRGKTLPSCSPIKLSFAASRLCAMIRQFELSYSSQFVQGNGEAS